MFRSLNTAASGMIAQQLNLDNIANNLANASTAGFRKRRLQFQDLLYQNLIMPGAASTQQTTFSTGLQIGLGARSSASEMVQTQGDFEQTGNPLDLAIQGTGLFPGPAAQRRTGLHALRQFSSGRAGQRRHLRRLSSAALDHHSHNATSITIGTDGTVSVTLPGQQQRSRWAKSSWPRLRIPAA